MGKIKDFIDGLDTETIILAPLFGAAYLKFFVLPGVLLDLCLTAPDRTGHYFVDFANKRAAKRFCIGKHIFYTVGLTSLYGLAGISSLQVDDINNHYNQLNQSSVNIVKEILQDNLGLDDSIKMGAYSIDVGNKKFGTIITYYDTDEHNNTFKNYAKVEAKIDGRQMQKVIDSYNSLVEYFNDNANVLEPIYNEFPTINFTAIFNKGGAKAAIDEYSKNVETLFNTMTDYSITKIAPVYSFYNSLLNNNYNYYAVQKSESHEPSVYYKIGFVMVEGNNDSKGYVNTDFSFYGTTLLDTSDVSVSNNGKTSKFTISYLTEDNTQFNEALVTIDNKDYSRALYESYQDYAYSQFASPDSKNVLSFTVLENDKKRDMAYMNPNECEIEYYD